jgi:hypothetical protein
VTALLVAAACVAAAAGTLVGVSGLARLRFGRLPGAFRCRLGSPGRPPQDGAVWRLRRTRAVWHDEVLLVQSGLLRLGVAQLPARPARNASVQFLEPFAVRGLGPQPVALLLTVDGDRPLVVATSAGSRTALVGPYLVASVPGLPRAPRGHGV